MKPLDQWTDEELRDEIYDGERLDPDQLVDELLRRARAAERERCAKLADESAKQCRDHAARGFPNEADLTAESLAEDIRALT